MADDDDTNPLDQLPPPPASGIPTDTDLQNAEAGGSPAATDSQATGGNQPIGPQQTPEEEEAGQANPQALARRTDPGFPTSGGAVTPTQGLIQRGGDPAAQAKMMQDYIAGDGSQKSQAALKQAMDGVRTEGDDDSATFIKAVDGQNDPRDATKLMRAGRYLFNQNMGMARVFWDKGDRDKAAITLNHAYAYVPGGYQPHFDSSGQSMVANVKKLGSSDPATVVNLPDESFTNWIHGDAKNYNSHMEGDTLQSLQQAAQNAKGQGPGPQGEAVADKEGSFAPRGSAAGPPAAAQGPSPEQLSGETPPAPTAPGTPQGPETPPGATRDENGVARAGPDYDPERQARYQAAAQGAAAAPAAPADNTINVNRYGVNTPYNKATGAPIGPSTNVPAALARQQLAQGRPGQPSGGQGAGKNTQEAAAQRQATHDKTVFENSSQLQKQKAFLAHDDRLERKQDGTVDFKEEAKPQKPATQQQGGGVQQEAQTNPQEVAKAKQLPFVGVEADIKRMNLKSGTPFIGPDGRQGTVP